ncbi:MAG TPA: hypothetical protein VD815_00615 [Candidatus Saccharimonadales bacterium]|nr:hypothetical protein [Candidatus Saccharimonadales bacterium]
MLLVPKVWLILSARVFLQRIIPDLEFNIDSKPSLSSEEQKERSPANPCQLERYYLSEFLLVPSDDSRFQSIVRRTLLTLDS